MHDLVDDLMEVVTIRGGQLQLALVGNGDLAEHGRLALISRPSDPFRGPGPRMPLG